MLRPRYLAPCAALFFVCFSPAAAAAQQAGGKFACELVEGEQFEDGRMVPSPRFTFGRANGLEAFTFDEQTGEFHWKRLDMKIGYQVVQRGSTVNGIVAVASKQGPRSYSVKTLRISSYAPVYREGERLYPVMLIDEDQVGTGFCRMTGLRKQ